MKKDSYSQLKIRVPNELYTAVQARALASNKSMTHIVNQALVSYMSSNQIAPLPYSKNSPYEDAIKELEGNIHEEFALIKSQINALQLTQNDMLSDMKSFAKERVTSPNGRVNKQNNSPKANPNTTQNSVSKATDNISKPSSDTMQNESENKPHWFG